MLVKRVFLPYMGIYSILGKEKHRKSICTSRFCW